MALIRLDTAKNKPVNLKTEQQNPYERKHRIFFDIFKKLFFIFKNLINL